MNYSKSEKLLLAGAATWVLLLVFINVSAQKDQLEKVWYTNGKGSKIEMFKTSDGNFCGKIIWIKDDIDEATGKPKLDKENPDENQRNKPLQGLVIMTGFKKNPDNKDEYIDGKIYDPSKGRTYCAKITFKGMLLDLKGFICHLSFLGRTEVWTLAEGQ